MVIETGPQQGSTTYSVPLTSAIKFSPLYDPHDNIEEAKQGYFFNSAAEIIPLKVLPKVCVCVCVCVREREESNIYVFSMCVDCSGHQVIPRLKFRELSVRK